MQIQQLEYVLKVAECGSITQAAQQLYISQPSLTKSIMNLENEYGIKIFERSSKGIQVTAEGEKFIYYAKSVVASLSSLNKAFAPEPEADKRVLSVASQQLDFLYDLLLDCYQKCGAGNLHFNTVECNRSDVIRAVLSRDVNIGIIVQSSADSKAFSWLAEERKLEVHEIASSEVYLSCGPKCKLYAQKEDSLSPAQTKARTHVVLDMESEAIQSLYFGAEAHSYNLNRMAFFNTISACKKFLLETDACLYTPQWVLGFFEGTGIRTFRIDYGENGPVNKLCWIKRISEPVTQAEQDFVNQLLQYVANHS